MMPKPKPWPDRRDECLRQRGPTLGRVPFHEHELEIESVSLHVDC
jgi:hypothetical protein